MHSTLVRVQNVFGYFTTVAFSLAAVIALSVILSPQTPSAELSLRNVQVVRGRPHYYSSKREEYAHIKFDLDADLSSLFTWNTKQVFVYVTATFPTTSKIPKKRASTPYSEAIVWDAILPGSVLPAHHNTYTHPRPHSPSSSGSSGSGGGKKSKNPANTKDTDPHVPPPRAHAQGKSNGILTLPDQKPKYRITTPAGKIQGLENCTLTLKYNVQPWVGALVWADFRPVRSSGGGGGGAAAGAKRWWGNFCPPAWSAVVGGKSAAFEMPEVGDGKAAGAGAGSGSRSVDLQTETGGEANRGSPA